VGTAERFSFLRTGPFAKVRPGKEGRAVREPGAWRLQPSVGVGRLGKPSVQVKRVYEPPSRDDGVRVLVDRLWPRGLSKLKADVDLWLKDLAPSRSLRRWFNHDPARWAEFKERYAVELDAKTLAVSALVGAARRGRITLLYGARDVEHNNAVALHGYLSQRRP
jgi:uncharacterized protein YeaO (DUF488 family)